jgi:hypothetical protein
LELVLLDGLLDVILDSAFGSTNPSPHEINQKVLDVEGEGPVR